MGYPPMIGNEHFHRGYSLMPQKSKSLISYGIIRQALALSRPIEQGVELRAERLTHWRRDRRQFPGELVDRVAEAMAETCSWKQRPHALAGAVEAIDEHPFDPVRRLLLRCRALKLLIGLGKGRRTGVLRIPQMTEHATTANGREVHLVCQTTAMLLIGQ